MSGTVENTQFTPPASPLITTQVWLPWPHAVFDYLTADDGSVITTDDGEPIVF